MQYWWVIPCGEILPAQNGGSFPPLLKNFISPGRCLTCMYWGVCSCIACNNFYSCVLLAMPHPMLVGIPVVVLQEICGICHESSFQKRIFCRLVIA